jgi:hypothetical protein
LASGYSALMADESRTDPLLDLGERRRKERQAVEEAGGGQSEGFELAEQELIEHTSHGDGHAPAKIARDAYGEGVEEEPTECEYGEADEEHRPD